MLSVKVNCPTCKQWTQWEDNPFRPFCSERCRLLDLGRWANEEYRVPVQEESPDIKEKEEKEE